MGTHSVGRETGADRSAYSGTTGWAHHEFTAGRPPGRSVSNFRLCLPVMTYKHHYIPLSRTRFANSGLSERDAN